MLNPWEAHGGVFIEQWRSHEAPMAPQVLQEGLMAPPGQQKKLARGGLEVKSGQIAPSLGGRKRHVAGWFSNLFWINFRLFQPRL